MSESSLSPLFNGMQPALVGKPCQGFICEAYRHEGMMVCSANVTFIKVADVWHRLSIDIPAIFWRECRDEPRPWAVEEDSFDYPHVDVGAIAGVIGRTLTSCDTVPRGDGVSVVFGFSNGCKIEIASRQDTTSYEVS